MQKIGDSVSELDIDANRRSNKYSLMEYGLRILWGLGQIGFRFTPRTFFNLRNLILRIFGAKIGRNVHIYNSAIIYFPWNLEIGDESSIGEWALIYNLGKVQIGRKATISHKAHLCAGSHDYTRVDLPLLKKGISIGDQVWICAEAFISAGVNIGVGSVVGARSVVTRDVGPWNVVAGNPARFIKGRQVSR